MNIALIIGSLRQDSINRQVAEVLQRLSPADWTFSEVKLDDLPVYNQDFDAQDIASYARVRAQVKAADAVLFVTPEHNRSVPAAVKNILDIASRPAGESVWAGKSCALATASPSTYGGLSSGLHLRQILQALGARVHISPEVHLSRVFDLFNDAGELDHDKTEAFLQQFVDSLADWLSS